MLTPLLLLLLTVPMTLTPALTLLTAARRPTNRG